MQTRAYLRRLTSRAGHRALLQSIFDTSDAIEIQRSVDVAIEDVTGVRVRRWIDAQASNGLALVIELADGERCFVKFHLPSVTASHLRRLRALQASAHEAGFACAETLKGPVRFRQTHFVVDGYLSPRTTQLVRNSRTRTALASGFHQLNQLLTEWAPATWSPSTSSRPRRRDGVWPKTGNPRFSAVLQVEHPWLDAIGGEARAIIDTVDSQLMIGHGDWRMENVRVWGDDVVAIYDWDSLTQASEIGLVGTTAILHPINWAFGHPAPASPRAVVEFVNAYERVRGRKFRRDERAAILASALYSIAFVAKCNYASDPDEKHWKGSAREYVHAHAHSFLGQRF